MVSKKEQRRMIADNFGMPLEYQERAVKLPHIIFFSAGTAVLNYATKKQEVTEHQRFYIRMCLLVLDQVKWSCLRIEEQFVPLANQSPEQTALNDLARLYCDARELCDPSSRGVDPLSLIKLAIEGGELVMKREYLDTSQVLCIEAFHHAAEALTKVVCDAHAEGEIAMTIKGILANR